MTFFESEQNNSRTSAPGTQQGHAAAPITDFGPFRIDRENATLSQAGKIIPLTPKAFALLCYLVGGGGQLATRDSIFAQVWQGTVVSDAALTVCIREIRAALGDNARNPRYIATVPKRGFRFICPTSPPATTTPPTPPNSQTPAATAADCASSCVVGRDIALETLQDCLHRALDGTRQLVLITGEPGIGKTTTITEFLHRNRLSEVAWVAKGQCIEHYGVGEAYLPILDMLGDLAGVANCPLAETLASHAPSWLPHLPAVVAEAAPQRLPVHTGAVHAESMMRELTDALQSIAAQRPLILILEDMHWSDHASVDLLSFLARRDKPAQLLIVATFRPIDAVLQSHPIKQVGDDLQLRGHCSSIALQFLDQYQIASYLLSTFPGHDFPENFAATVQHKCDGNPLFMINMLTYLQARKLLQCTDGQWQLSERFSSEDIAIPDDIERMINQQIDQLDPASQALLEAASIASEPGGIGTDFTLTEVAAALEVDELDLEGTAERLARNRHFLQPKGSAEWPDGTFSNCYEFTHALYQNVLYARVSALRKVQRHRQLGMRLERGYQPRVDQIANKLAVHFEIGRDYMRAVRYLNQAAETATTRGANREAIHALENARRLLTKVPESAERDQLELSVLLLLAPAITASQGNATPAIEHCYLRAGELCEQRGERIEHFRVLFGLRSFYIIRGDFDQAFALAESMLELATELDSEDFLLEAHVGLANSEYFAGNYQASHAHALKGIALYDRNTHAAHALMYGLDPGVFCYARAGQTAWFLGYPQQALQFVERAVGLAETLAHPYSLVFALHNRTQILLYHRDKSAVRESAQRGKALAHSHGFRFLQAWALHLNAFTLALTGDNDAALIEINRARRAQRPVSAATESWLATFLAEACVLLGEVELGFTCLAVPAMEHSDDAVRGCLKAELTLLSAASASERAEVLFREALQISRTQGVKACELRIATGLAQLLRRRQDYLQAHECLHPIVAWYQADADTADLLQARQLLTELDNLLKPTTNIVYLHNDRH